MRQGIVATCSRRNLNKTPTFALAGQWQRYKPGDCADNNVKNGSKLEVIAEKGKIVILPQKKSLDDMLNLVTPDNIHSEASTGNTVGKEEW